METIIDIIRSFPGILQWRKIKYNKKFSTNCSYNLFKGVYSSFNEAIPHIPKTKPEGYDHNSAAKMYTNLMDNIRLVDYPVIFWLNKIIKEKSVVFDFGGHVGIRFYCYSKYINYPNKLKWIVYDLPSVLEEGKKLAKEMVENKISFTNEIDVAGGSDIFLASGSLQYFEIPLYKILSNLKTSPKHILINGTPLHEDHEFVTINNMTTAYCLYKIQKKNDFINGMIENGWELKDIWINNDKDKKCHIPFYKDYNGSVYYGMYFVKSE